MSSLSFSRQQKKTVDQLPRPFTLTFVLQVAFVLAFVVSAIGRAQEPANLVFTFWGSPQEKTDVENMVAAFNDLHPDIHVQPQYIPNTGYDEKIATMVASGNPPDVAYLSSSSALQLASQGQLVNLSDYLGPQVKERLPNTYYRYGDAIVGASIGEVIVMYYRRELFDEAGLPYPPTTAEDAWSWDEFVKVAQKLTKDRNGNDAASSDFDPNNIETFGVSLNTSASGYIPFIYSNGGKFVDDEGTKLLLNQPKAVEALQRMQDLIYKYHVAPSPAQAESLPATDILMQTGKVAMDINGHWKVLDYSQLDMDWGMGVLPYFKEPVTMFNASARVVFAATKHPEAALEFYKFHTDPEIVSLFKKGLWMPNYVSYYTDSAKTDEWLKGEEGVYPPEARDVLVGYAYNHSPYQSPYYWLANQAQIFSEAVNPAMELLWSGEAAAQEAMDQAVRDAQPFMSGRQ